MFSRERLATLGLAPVSAKVAERAGAVLRPAKVAERAGAVLRPAKVAERAAAVQPAEQLAAERFLLELGAVLPDSAGFVGLRVARAPAEQIFSLAQAEFSRAVVPRAWRPPADPAFCLFRPGRTLLCLRRQPVRRAQSSKFESLSSVVPPLGEKSLRRPVVARKG
jgi:hypothetical protein